MDMTLKRVLTRKSILGFGYSADRHLSVQMLMDLGRHNILRSAYYGLDKIDFAEDVLDELGITKEYRIIKPGKDLKMKELFYHNLFYSENSKKTDLEKIKEAALVLKDKKENSRRRKISQNFRETKGYMKAKNQRWFREN
jgi:hypothetical protein